MKLSEKDKKTIRFGALAAAIILTVGGLNILMKEYSKTGKKLTAAKNKLESVLPQKDGALNHKQAGLYKIVPVFQTPKAEDIPGETFRKKFMEQLKKAGVKYTDLDLMPMSSKKNSAGFRTRSLVCKGKCSFAQAMDLQAALYENPWFVGVEEFKISSSTKNKSIMDMTIKVSTFIK